MRKISEMRWLDESSFSGTYRNVRENFAGWFTRQICWGYQGESKCRGLPGGDCWSRSIRTLFSEIGTVDAIISAAGSTVFKPFAELTPEENQRSIDSKLQGQVNLVLIGQHYLTEGGSITLTSGIIQDEFIPMGTSSALVNGAIGAFVASAALEIGRGIRINAVSRMRWQALGNLCSLIPRLSACRGWKSFCCLWKISFGIMTGRTFTVY